MGTEAPIRKVYDIPIETPEKAPEWFPVSEPIELPVPAEVRR